MVGPWGRYVPQWLRATGVAPPSVNTMSVLEAQYGIRCLCIPHTHKHASTHTHTHRTLPTTVSVLETPFDIHVSSVYQAHTCMQAPIPTLCIPAKNTHKELTHNVRPYAQVRYTSHLQWSYAVMRQLLLYLILRKDTSRGYTCLSGHFF